GLRNSRRSGAKPGSRKKPRSDEDRGRSGSTLLGLVGREVLPVAQVHDVLEHGRTGRKVRRVQEGVIEIVLTTGRAIHHGAALVNTVCVLRIVQADERSSVIERIPTPILDVTQEVVHTAICSKVLRPARSGVSWE